MKRDAWSAALARQRIASSTHRKSVVSARIVNSWKEIAAYLGHGVRTVQRWERQGLPVRRPAGKMRSAVFAVSDELDHWRQIHCPLDVARDGNGGGSVPLSREGYSRTLRANMREMLERTENLRDQMQFSIALLHELQNRMTRMAARRSERRALSPVNGQSSSSKKSRRTSERSSSGMDAEAQSA